MEQQPKNYLDCKVHLSLNINVFGVIILELEEEINEFHLFESILLEFSICIWILYDSMCSIKKICICDMVTPRKYIVMFYQKAFS